MRTPIDWHRYYANLARATASRSKDPRTQVGCVLVSHDGHVLSTGYNGFPAGVEETATLWTSPTKYRYVVHAEANAVARAARRGQATDGATAYVTLAPCYECAKLLLAAGIFQVVVATPTPGDADAVASREHLFQFRAARELFERTGVRVLFLD